MKSKLFKNKCEIDGCNICDPDALHFHHIIERTKINTTNHPFNLAILCAVHHELTHSGKLKIIGVYPSTKLPNKRTLVYELNGIKNIDIDTPYVEFKNKSFRVSGES
jgi:hypothetical protein